MKPLVILLSFALLTTGCTGSEINEKFAYLTWADPDKAAVEDTDFNFQGEYGLDQPDQPWGVQVIALGGGRFEAYLLEGGLPGLGWQKTGQRIQLLGTRSDEKVSLASKDKSYAATIEENTITVQQNKKELVKLPRLERESPTLGQQPPDGATVLFDGSSVDAWLNGQMENGLLKNTDITTKQTFGDYTLHLEFRTPYKPYARNQQRGNSGVYHQGRYETQVLDSFGQTGEMNETGGIYSIADPLLNMCFPPLRWQTYDVDFTAAKFDENDKLLENARMTVRLNGVIVQDNQELPHTTTASPIKEITPANGPIFIQHHGNPVFYRNIWIVPKQREANPESKPQ